LDVEIVTASCCRRGDIEQKIESVLRRLKIEMPELNWNISDIVDKPELALKYGILITPSILIDGKLEFVGFPQESAIESKIRSHYREEGVLSRS